MVQEKKKGGEAKAPPPCLSRNSCRTLDFDFANITNLILNGLFSWIYFLSLNLFVNDIYVLHFTFYVLRFTLYIFCIILHYLYFAFYILH